MPCMSGTGESYTGVGEMESDNDGNESPLWIVVWLVVVWLVGNALARVLP